MIHRFTAAVIVTAGLFGAPAVMAQDDADLGLWQAVTRSNTPADYQTYLELFPNGRFAALARIRAQGAAGAGQAAAAPAPAPAPGAAPAPAPAPAQAPEPDQDANAPQFSVTPTTGRIGQRFTVNCGTIPTGGRFDIIVAVPAGSPPSTQPRAGQGIDKEYVANCQTSNSDGTLQMGPLPPGRWQFRWITTLYNLENRPEVKATVDVVVR